MNNTTYRIFYTYPCETDERRVEREGDSAFVMADDSIRTVSNLRVGDSIYVYSVLGTITKIEIADGKIDFEFLWGLVNDPQRDYTLVSYLLRNHPLLERIWLKDLAWTMSQNYHTRDETRWLLTMVEDAWRKEQK